MSEIGVKQVAFFVDEEGIALGRQHSEAVFSLPYQSGRLVLRISLLTTSFDSAYGKQADMMAFDGEGRRLWSIHAPYIKIMPLSNGPQSSLLVLLRALDRTNQSIRWEPAINSLSQDMSGAVEIALPVSWEDFILLTFLHRGISGLSPVDLKRAAANLEACGYLPQVFEAELLQQFVKPLFLLPLGILTVAVGWRYRALKHPRYMVIPMLGILPLVFNGAVHLSRTWLKDIGFWAVISFGFNVSALFFGIGIVILLILSLIILAAQHN
jgi:hypothetical protein